MLRSWSGLGVGRAGVRVRVRVTIELSDRVRVSKSFRWILGLAHRAGGAASLS